MKRAEIKKNFKSLFAAVGEHPPQDQLVWVTINYEVINPLDEVDCQSKAGSFKKSLQNAFATHFKAYKAVGHMDVSDGLLQDLGHLCRAGRVGADIEAELVPRSDAARAAGPEWRALCLTGGDDYELLLAVPPAHAPSLVRTASAQGIPVTRIGRFVPGNTVRVLDAAGAALQFDRPGWSHF